MFYNSYTTLIKQSPLSCIRLIASGVIDLDPYGGSTDDEGASLKISPRVSSIESDGGDTEDEIRR